MTTYNMTSALHRVQIKTVPLIFSQWLLQMCTDLHDLWYATLKVNTNYTGKFITLHGYMSHTSFVWW